MKDTGKEGAIAAFMDDMVRPRINIYTAKT